MQFELFDQHFNNIGIIKINEDIESWELENFEFIMEKSSYEKLNFEDSFYTQFEKQLAKKILKSSPAKWQDFHLPKFIKAINPKAFEKLIVKSKINFYQLDRGNYVRLFSSVILLF